ncbi:TAXI family TRAP transporter solute-binding subunit [Bosea sp. RAF48]|uniref:TAXI family TRAP transporter solute-binding subunit n=1 Tax=Bosea sp. RAF48 TaxID=3237480 RepID=UPI003F8E619D
MNIAISRLLLLAAATLALITATSVAYLAWSRPLHLRVAAGPKDGIDAKLLIALNRLLEINRAGVRVDLVATADVHANNQLLEKREVDLAVIRLDDPLPTSAGLVVLLRTNVVIAVAPARHKLESLSDVKGKRLGLVSRTPLDEPSFVRLLDMLGLTPADVHLTIVKPEDIAGLIASGRIDCLAVIGVPADPVVRAVVAAAGDRKKNPPTILSIEFGESLKQNTAAASSEAIEKFAFPRLSIPDEDVDTVGVPTVLAANRASTGPLRVRLYNNAITEVTRSLLERRSELAREVPLANLIAPPESEKEDARFPIHPGTAAYLEDTDTSWSTLFSDQIWNVVLVGGVASSVLAAASSYLKKGGPDRISEILGSLKSITERAGASTDPADALGLSKELGVLTIDMATLGYQRRCSYEEFAPLQLAYESARDAVAMLHARPATAAHTNATTEAAERPAPLERERTS